MLQQEIERECKRYGRKLAIYLKAELEEALNRKHKKPMEADLHFKEDVVATNDGVKIQILAYADAKPVDYWQFIEYGVNGTKVNQGSEFNFKKGAIDFDAVGKEWQNKNNINPVKVLLDIEAKYRRKTLQKRGLSVTRKRLSKMKIKALSYNEAASKLSRVFAVAIARDGLEAKPFVQKGIADSKPEEFKKRISELMGKEISFNLALTGRDKNIKITF
jgi:hypothetical protein